MRSLEIQNSTTPGDIIGMAENLVKYVDYNRLNLSRLLRRRPEDIDEYAYQVELTGSLIFVYIALSYTKFLKT